MTGTPVEEILDNLTLDEGAHENWEQGACLLEATAYVAGEPFSDHPKCVSPVLGAYGRTLNDRLSDVDRQKLKPFIPRLIGTAGDGKDEVRGWLAADWVIRVASPRWLDVAGMSGRAAELRALPGVVDHASAVVARSVAFAVRDEARVARDEARVALRERVEEELRKRGKPAAVVAAVDAAAVAAVDAAAVAAADAAAVAVAAVDADAAVAAAAAAAVAAAADAVAEAATVAVAWGTTSYWKVYDAVREALREWEEDVESRFVEVRRVNNEEAIALLGRLIEGVR